MFVFFLCITNKVFLDCFLVSTSILLFDVGWLNYTVLQPARESVRNFIRNTSNANRCYHKMCTIYNLLATTYYDQRSVNAVSHFGSQKLLSSCVAHFRARVSDQRYPRFVANRRYRNYYFMQNWENVVWSSLHGGES